MKKDGLFDISKEQQELLGDMYDELNDNNRCVFMPKIEAESDCEEESNTTPEDVVNHPSHYETGKFECIDVMLETQGTEAVMDFCICNAFKYLYRHKNKNGIEDIKKARWYINKYIEIQEKE